MHSNDDDAPASYASPPCFMHELDPEYTGLASSRDVSGQEDVKRWRKAEREKQIAARLAVPAQRRGDFSQILAEGLDRTLGDPEGLTVSIYWPFRGEPDLRPWVARVIGRGGLCALPVVVKPAAPLIFRRWAPGDAMERGVWNIPIPAAEAAEVMPDIVIAPVVGFDPECYRLGYGGGFFDRTLAAMPRKPRIIGVGYAQARIPTIYPQPHDIPMDVIITENGVSHPVAT